METLYYDGSILPQITLLGKDTIARPHCNIRRISQDYIFYFVCSGTLTFFEGDREVTLEKGDTYLFEPGILQYAVKETLYNLFFVHFRHPSISTDREAIPGAIPIAKQMRFHDKANFEKLSYQFEQILKQRDRRLEYSSVITASAVSAFFAEAAQRDHLRSERFGEKSRNVAVLVEDVIAYLNKNYGSSISGKQLEQDFSYNFDYINQLFRRYLGTSVFRMLEDIRMEKACNLLLTDTRPISQIAWEVGYSEETYFSKVFKKNNGVSPSAYRNKTQILH